MNMNNPYKTVSIEDARFKPDSSAPEAILRFDGCLQIQCNAPDGTLVGILIHQRGWRELVSELVTADDARVAWLQALTQEDLDALQR